jgi:hypothetical protein
MALKRHLEGQTENIPFTYEDFNPPQITIGNYSFRFRVETDGATAWNRITILTGDVKSLHKICMKQFAKMLFILQLISGVLLQLSII